jgi:AraC family transcriptional regulator
MVTSTPSTSAIPSRRHQAGGILLAEASYAPGSWLAPHEHARTSFVYVLDGSWLEKVGRHDTSLQRGMLFVRRGGVPHANIFGPTGARCVFLEAPEPQRILTDIELPGSQDHFRVDDPEVTRLGMRLASESWGDDPINSLLLEGLSLELIARVLRTNSPRFVNRPAWLVRAHDRLRSEWAHPPSITALAREAEVSPTVFTRTFRRHYRMRPATVVHMARIDVAMELMRSPDLPLMQIARSSGFADQSHLGRIFRRLVGTTPAAYRQERYGAQELKS